MIPEKICELEEDDYNFGYAQGWNACVDALAAPRQPGEMGAGVQQAAAFSCAKRAADPQNESAACRQWCGNSQTCLTSFDTAKFFRHVDTILSMGMEQREQSTFGAGDATPELMAAIRVVSEIEAKARKAASAQQDEREAVGVLAPCPFCGGEHIKLVDLSGWEAWCEDCGACAGCTTNGDANTREQMVAAWNRRAIPEARFVWGASTLADLDGALNGAHELSGPPHERIATLIAQRDAARAAQQVQADAGAEQSGDSNAPR